MLVVAVQAPENLENAFGIALRNANAIVLDRDGLAERTSRGSLKHRLCPGGADPLGPPVERAVADSSGIGRPSA